MFKYLDLYVNIYIFDDVFVLALRCQSGYSLFLILSAGSWFVGPSLVIHQQAD